MSYCVQGLINQNFNVVFLNAVQQYWRTTKYFQCIGDPKKQNLLLFLYGGDIKYTDKHGNILTAHSGDIVYTPVGSEYYAELINFDNVNYYTIGINFMILDESGNPVTFSDKIQIFSQDNNVNASVLFKDVAKNDFNMSYIQKRVQLLRILQTLYEENIIDNNKSIINPGLNYLVSHISETPSVGILAEKCNISEGYFRKQFKIITNMSPVEYRNKLRLEKACTYLEYGDISVQEISDMLGYSTVSHFIKEFGKHYGMSPLKYRKRFRS